MKQNRLRVKTVQLDIGHRDFITFFHETPCIFETYNKAGKIYVTTLKQKLIFIKPIKHVMNLTV